jgi:hypothetical protein
MRIFLFLLFCVVFSVRDEVSIKRPTSIVHYLHFISDILVVSYVLSCAEPAESDSIGADSAGARALRWNLSHPYERFGWRERVPELQERCEGGSTWLGSFSIHDYPRGASFIMDNITFHKFFIERNSVRLYVQPEEYSPRGSLRTST